MVRVSTGSLRFVLADGRRFDLRKAVSAPDRPGSVASRDVATAGASVDGRVCAIRKSDAAIGIALEKLRRKAAKNGRTPKPLPEAERHPRAMLRQGSGRGCAVRAPSEPVHRARLGLLRHHVALFHRPRRPNHRAPRALEGSSSGLPADGAGPCADPGRAPRVQTEFRSRPHYSCNNEGQRGLDVVGRNARPRPGSPMCATIPLSIGRREIVLAVAPARRRISGLSRYPRHDCGRAVVVRFSLQGLNRQAAAAPGQRPTCSESRHALSWSREGH